MGVEAARSSRRGGAQRESRVHTHDVLPHAEHRQQCGVGGELARRLVVCSLRRRPAQVAHGLARGRPANRRHGGPPALTHGRL
eukprot:1415388-Prymnesium_polylepis.1